MESKEPVNEVSAKPKRVLTEAQRLAFMKGREKRLANLEKKRQEKLEAEGVTEPMVAEPKETAPLPPPSPPVLRRQVASDLKDVIPPDFAKTVVDMLYEKITTTASPPRPKRTYTKRVTKVMDSPPRQVTPPPQRVFNWM
jgi:hypothetical protein